MSKIIKALVPAALVLSLFSPLESLAQRGAPPPPPPDPTRNTKPPVTEDWLTFNHDQQRSGWANAEKTLTKKNVSRLKLLWSTQLSTPIAPSSLQTLTAPLVASDVTTADGVKTLVVTLGNDNTLHAVDAVTGKLVWKKNYKITAKPLRPADWLCSNDEQATPVIDKRRNLVYLTTSDGNLRAVDLSNGNDRMAPVPFMAPFSRNWSLNLIDNVVYSVAARGCGGDAANPIEAGNVAAADVNDLAHVQVNRVFTGTARAAGPWSRGGVALGPQGVYTQTADGLVDPAAGFFGNTVLAIRPGGRGVADSFTPPNWKEMNAKDYDLGSGSPVVFSFHGSALIATGAKESVVYLLDANGLGGGAPVHDKAIFTTPRFGNDAGKLFANGIWGAFSTYENEKGERFVYAPMWNALSKDAPKFPNANGDTSQGSIVALQVVQNAGGLSLVPAWVSGVNQAPDSPVVANGVVYAVGTGEQTTQVEIPRPTDAKRRDKYRSTPVGHQILYAFDAETGKQLYSSGDTLPDWNHFGEPVVSQGRVFVISHDAHIYAFGLK